MIKEICTWIELQIPTMVIGAKLQVGHREQTAPDRCCVVQETGGGDTNFYVKDMKWVQIQVVARGLTYFEARADALAIDAILHGAAGIEFGISPVFYRASITGVAVPQYIGQDDERRYEFSTNYRVAIYNKAGS
jgi:hypothetical protein